MVTSSEVTGSVAGIDQHKHSGDSRHGPGARSVLRVELAMSHRQPVGQGLRVQWGFGVRKVGGRNGVH